MITTVKIDNFKCLYDEELEFKPLTIITGLNSTGKSSLIQSILFPFTKGADSFLLADIITPTFESLRNKYKNSQSMSCEYKSKEGAVSFNIQKEGSVEIIEDKDFNLSLEKNIYYLSANRIGVRNTSKNSSTYFIGINGEYILGSFEKEKSTSIRDVLIKDTKSYTLSTQVNYWLTYITEISTELSTEARPNDFIETSFKSDGLNNILPSNLGTGIGYLAKILITCLRAKENDIIIIENPEIHLHPASRAKLGEFLAFIVNAKIQIIIETHCEHLINKIGYEIYKKKFKSEDVTVFYKKGIQDKFEVIEFEKDGKFTVDFPDGFFDATLTDLLEME